MRSLKELMALKGRVAVVTGGGGHIGGVICEALAEMGASITVLDINEESCVDTARRVESTYQVDTLPLRMDLSNRQAVSDTAESVLGKCGRLDILVNCAAFVGTSDLEGWTVPFPDQSVSAWGKAMDIGLTAPFVLVQACAEALTQPRSTQTWRWRSRRSFRRLQRRTTPHWKTHQAKAQRRLGRAAHQLLGPSV